LQQRVHPSTAALEVTHSRIHAFKRLIFSAFAPFGMVCLFAPWCTSVVCPINFDRL
jgi:hypothetical protein